MSVDPLPRAIELIKQGKHIEAQEILKPVIAADHHNLPAWFWFVETCSTNKQRTDVLEICLEYNPNSEQVKQALEKLRILSSNQLQTILPKFKYKPPLGTSQDKYRSLIKSSVVSAVIITAINGLYWSFFFYGFNRFSYSFIIFLFATPVLLPFPTLLATAIVYLSQHKGVSFIIGIGVPLIFNILGTFIAAQLVGLYYHQTHPLPPNVNINLTGEYSDRIGTFQGENSLDVFVGVKTDQAHKFSVFAQLIAGDQIISTTSTDIVSLVPGNNTLILQFPGSDIRQFRLDGPYQVKILPGIQDDKNDTWQTKAYHWNDFGN